MLRAATLEKEAADARLETERIKEVVAWRVLSPTVSLELQRALAANPGSVNLKYTDGDPEALFLAIQLSRILSAAHWNVGFGAFQLRGTIVFGLDLPPDSSADAKTLRDAFQMVHIQFGSEPLPPTGSIGFMDSTIPGAPTLSVGSKPRPLP